MQDDKNHQRLQVGGAIDGQIDWARRFRLDPVTETAQRAVGDNRRADAGAKRVEGGVTGRALHDRFDLGSMLIVVTKRRQRDLGFAGLAVAQDQEACGWHALWQHVAAQGGGGQRRKPRVQRGEDGFARCGQ
jgi:hypothetical protein